MMTKIYFSLWIIYFLVLAAYYVSGAMTPTSLLVFGFISFGMVFMGIMGVLPTSVHDSHVRH